MGKVGGSNSWLNAVKKVFRSPSKDQLKEKREEQQQDEDEKKRGKSRWIFRKPLFRETTYIQRSSNEEETENAISALTRNSACYKNMNEAVEVEKRCTIAAALASAAAAEAAQAAMEVLRFTNNTRRPIISDLRFREQLHFAAITIQTVFRAYLARKALKALKGLVKLQALVRGHNVRGRAKMTLQCMQSMVRVQTQLCDERSRRLSSSSSPSLKKKKTRNSIFKEYENNDRMEEEIQTLERYLNCKRGLDFSIIQESPHEYSTFDNERTSIRTIREDTSQSHNFSPSQSPSKPLHSITPRKSKSKPSHDTYDNSSPKPNYMSDTASTKARIRTQSAPRMRPVTPERDHQHNSHVAKRRMSGRVQDQYNSDVDDSEFVAHFNQSMPRSSHVRAWLR